MAAAYEHSVSATGETGTLTPAGTERRAWIGGTQDAAGSTANTQAAVLGAETYSPFPTNSETSNVAGQYLFVMESDGEPSSGSATASVAGSSSVMAGTLGLACSGVDQTTPSDGHEIAEATDDNLSLAIASRVGDLVAAFGATNFDTTANLVATGDSPTLRHETAIGGHTQFMVTAPGAAGDVNIGADWAASGNVRAGLIAWNIRAAGAGGSVHELSASATGQAATTTDENDVRAFAVSNAGAAASSATMYRTASVSTSGLVAGLGISSADMDVRRMLSVSVAGTSTTSASPTGTRILTTSVTGLGVSTVDLDMVRGLTAGVSGAATAASTLLPLRFVSATGQAVASVTLAMRRALSASVTATGATTVTLDEVAAADAVLEPWQYGRYAPEHAAALNIIRELGG